MRISKTVFTNPIVTSCSISLVAFLARFVYITTKWKCIGNHIPQSYHLQKKPFVAALWHDRLMLAPCMWNFENPLHVLASAHTDGKLIAKVAEKFGMVPVYGSTGKGIAALKNLISILKKQKYVAIIPDGPRGPRHTASPGIITIAKLSKVDILPFSYVVKRYFRLKSWDRFIFVPPFNKGVCIWGDPIKYEEIEHLTVTEACNLLQNRINYLSSQAADILKL